MVLQLESYPTRNLAFLSNTLTTGSSSANLKAKPLNNRIRLNFIWQTGGRQYEVHVTPVISCTYRSLGLAMSRSVACRPSVSEPSGICTFDVASSTTWSPQPPLITTHASLSATARTTGSTRGPPTPTRTPSPILARPARKA